MRQENHKAEIGAFERDQAVNFQGNRKFFVLFSVSFLVTIRIGGRWTNRALSNGSERHRLEKGDKGSR